MNNKPDCDVATGICYCKENVEGKNCEKLVQSFGVVKFGNVVLL